MLQAFLAISLAAAAAQDSSSATVERIAPEAVEIAFEGYGGFELKGTLLLPARAADEGEAPREVPALLLLPGSGPTDRNGNQPPLLRTDLLKEIAERLAADGVATLRYDKRAAAVYAAAFPRSPEELDEFFAWECFTGDAAAAFRTLRGRAEVRSDAVGILGHSEGGLIALQLGRDLAGEESPAALVLAATAGRTLDVVIREQIGASLERGRVGEAETEKTMSALDAAIAAVLTGSPLPEDLPFTLRPLFNPTVMKLLRSYFTTDPAELAAAYPGPVLLVQGESDLQVSAERDASVLAAALKARAKAAFEFLLVPAASHNLKTVKKPTDHGFGGPVVPAALDGISRWITATLGG